MRGRGGGGGKSATVGDICLIGIHVGGINHTNGDRRHPERRERVCGMNGHDAPGAKMG